MEMQLRRIRQKKVLVISTKKINNNNENQMSSGKEKRIKKMYPMIILKIN